MENLLNQIKNNKITIFFTLVNIFLVLCVISEWRNANAGIAELKEIIDSFSNPVYERYLELATEALIGIEYLLPITALVFFIKNNIIKTLILYFLVNGLGGFSYIILLIMDLLKDF